MGWRHIGEPSGGGRGEGRPLGKGSWEGFPEAGVLKECCCADGGGRPGALRPQPSPSKDVAGGSWSLEKDVEARHSAADEQYRPESLLKRKCALET